MATITEDYVSFKTAKLLKEKGFDGILPFIYVNTEKSDREVHLTDTLCNYNDDHIKDVISAPTLQMAMKWLREEYKYFIEIRYSFVGKEEYGYEFKIRKTGEDDIGIWSLNDELYDSYEKSAEAAIKYCLENLI